MIGETTHNRMLSEKTESIKSSHIHIHTYTDTGIFIYNSIYFSFWTERERDGERDKNIPNFDKIIAR